MPAVTAPNNLPPRGLGLDDADQLGQALGQLGHGVEFMRFAFARRCFKPRSGAVGRVTGTADDAEEEVARVAGATRTFRIHRRDRRCFAGG